MFFCGILRLFAIWKIISSLVPLRHICKFYHSDILLLAVNADLWVLNIVRMVCIEMPAVFLSFIIFPTRYPFTCCTAF